MRQVEAEVSTVLTRTPISTMINTKREKSVLNISLFHSNDEIIVLFMIRCQIRWSLLLGLTSYGICYLRFFCLFDTSIAHDTLHFHFESSLFG